MELKERPSWFISILWALVAVNVVLTLLAVAYPGRIPIPLFVLVPVAFALLHGAQRYGWIGMKRPDGDKGTPSLSQPAPRGNAV